VQCRICNALAPFFDCLLRSNNSPFIQFISKIAAVVIPVLFGLLWMVSHSAVFIAGAGMAVISLGLALLVPSKRCLEGGIEAKAL